MLLLLVLVLLLLLLLMMMMMMWLLLLVRRLLLLLLGCLQGKYLGLLHMQLWRHYTHVGRPFWTEKIATTRIPATKVRVRKHRKARYLAWRAMVRPAGSVGTPCSSATVASQQQHTTHQTSRRTEQW
jgi:hypothetical protein